MQKLEQIKSILTSVEVDAEKFGKNGNKAAGTRIRKGMLEIAKLTKAVRQEVSDIKNA